MDEVTDSFTQGTTDYAKTLDKLVKDLYDVDTTIRIDGGARGTANLLQDVGLRVGAGGGGAGNWKVDAVCDVLVVQKACLQHSKVGRSSRIFFKKRSWKTWKRS